MSDDAKQLPSTINPEMDEPVLAKARARVAKRKAGRLAPPKLAIDEKTPGTVSNDPDDPHSYLKILDTFAVTDPDAASLLFSSLTRLEATSVNRGDVGPSNAALALVSALEPRDAAEGMLISEMVGTHMLAMECLRRSNIEGQTFEGRDVNLRHAERLMRIYTQQVDALNKHRGKGQQRVTVEHVTVNEGGQAVVGSLER